MLFAGEPLKILGLRHSPLEKELSGRTPGDVRLVDGRAHLQTSNGVLELARVQPAGKPAMDGAAWLRGRGGQAELS
jgi:methionyl-tRNA formyltransferase